MLCTESKYSSGCYGTKRPLQTKITSWNCLREEEKSEYTHTYTNAKREKKELWIYGASHTLATSQLNELGEWRIKNIFGTFSSRSSATVSWAWTETRFSKRKLRIEIKMKISKWMQLLHESSDVIFSLFSTTFSCIVVSQHFARSNANQAVWIHRKLMLLLPIHRST